MDLIIEFKKYVPKYCRIMRVQRDIPTYMTEAGVDKTNLRQEIENEMKKKVSELKKPQIELKKKKQPPPANARSSW